MTLGIVMPAPADVELNPESKGWLTCSSLNRAWTENIYTGFITLNKLHCAGTWLWWVHLDVLLLVCVGLQLLPIASVVSGQHLKPEQFCYVVI